MSKSFFHLRPNKYVDRELFVQILKTIISANELKKYHYYGFGSYSFDDFKLIHNHLDIQKMTSLEQDVEVYKRATFNRPLNCIDILCESSTDFIADFEPEENKNYIFWLDYMDPATLAQQFTDYCTLIAKLEPGDVIRLTLNANPSSLGYSNSNMGLEEKQQHRLVVLRNRLGSFVAEQTEADCITTSGYPLLLLSCLQNATIETLPENKFSTKFLLPLSATRYADGQQMLTFTGIMLDCCNEADRIKGLLEELTFCGHDWNQIFHIQVPALTQKELTAINEQMPISDETHLVNVHGQFQFVFNKLDMLRKYAVHYKCYPNFHHVSS